jgi:hypothetical protein
MNKPYVPPTGSLFAAGFVHDRERCIGVRYYTPDGKVAITIHPERFEVHIAVLSVETHQWHSTFAGKIRSEIDFWLCISKHVPLALMPVKCKECLVRIGINMV